MDTTPSTCPKCKCPTPGGAVECPKCGLIFAKYRAAQAAAADAEAERPTMVAIPIVTPDAQAPRRFPWQWVVAGVLGILGVMWLAKPDVAEASNLVLAASSQGEADPCNETPRCLVVYLSPWCPTCQKAGPLLKELRSRFHQSPKLGVKAVVGLDQASRLETYASNLGSPTFVDGDDAFYKSAGLSGVPGFLVLDPKGRVLERFSGLYPDVDSQLQKLKLDPERLVLIR
ncbi:MAG: TlpA family protein disulfide reductase [Myxococcaceae bacterium]